MKKALDTRNALATLLDVPIGTDAKKEKYSMGCKVEENVCYFRCEEKPCEHLTHAGFDYAKPGAKKNVIHGIGVVRDGVPEVITDREYKLAISNINKTIPDREQISREMMSEWCQGTLRSFMEDYLYDILTGEYPLEQAREDVMSFHPDRRKRK